MTIGATLWGSLRELVIAVGRKLIGWLLRGMARKWGWRRLHALWERYESVKKRNGASWRLNWIMARIRIWHRIIDFARAQGELGWMRKRPSPLQRSLLCECSKLAKKEGIPMDSPDDVEPKRKPRRAA
jgi:hypothetical protein